MKILAKSKYTSPHILAKIQQSKSARVKKEEILQHSEITENFAIFLEVFFATHTTAARGYVGVQPQVSGEFTGDGGSEVGWRQVREHGPSVVHFELAQSDMERPRLDSCTSNKYLFIGTKSNFRIILLLMILVTWIPGEFLVLAKAHELAESPPIPAISFRSDWNTRRRGARPVLE